MSNQPEENIPDNGFTFEISLSVLNLLGRNLYRTFATVLGEAISNAWDADAKNVWIVLDREANNFVIKDDGDGMTADDFQNKFLNIGYSKRKSGKQRSPGNRPFIGRKGIGKLALLSCAETITIMSKVEGGEYVGGTIENKGLDEAITENLMPQEYKLVALDTELLAKHTGGHKKGTTIIFAGVNSGIRNTPEYLKKVIALYFRFSLIDDDFNIYVDEAKVTHEDLRDLADKTEFLWKTEGYVDPYVDTGLTKLLKQKTLPFAAGASGFISSVIFPKDLNIHGTGERVSIDLFVNGRLREKDILRHIPTRRVAESYLYGQIHVNGMDSPETDRFTTSRENVMAEDPKFKEFLDEFKGAMEKVIKDWDEWRLERGEDGDPENETLSRKQRKSRELFGAVAEDYAGLETPEAAKKIDEWVRALAGDAGFNFESFAECFVSENLIRNLIEDKTIALSPEAQTEVTKYRAKEAQKKANAGMSINLRRVDKDLSYLDMDGLANLADKKPAGQTCLAADAKQYKPMRDAVMHTALLSDEAKRKLTSVYDNIKARVRHLLNGGS